MYLKKDYYRKRSEKMIVYYEKNGGNLRSVIGAEYDVMSPTLPANMETKEQITYYRSKDMDFISLPYEIGGAIFDYKVCINDKGEFIGLQPITE